MRRAASAADLRVLVLPQEIAGVASRFVTGLRMNDVHADAIFRGRHPFDYEMPTSRGLVSTFSRLVWFVDPARRSDTATWRLLSVLCRTLALPFLIARFNAFVYVGPATFTGFAAERSLVRYLGRTVVTVFLGSDARPPYLDGNFVCPAKGTPTSDGMRRLTLRTARRVRSAENGSTYVVSHPPMSGLHTKPFIDWATMGLPAPAETPGRQRRATSGPVRVCHAPSLPQWKGSAQIRAAVETLASEGLDVSYTELTGMPHKAVLDEMARCDLFIDQLYSDVFLSGAATEAAFVGAPTLVFGYTAESLADTARELGVGLRHYHSPDDLLPVLRRFISDADLREDVGRHVHDYVHRESTAQSVGARWRTLLTSGPELAWWRDPSDNDDVGGCCVEREARQRFLRRMVDEAGEESLQLAANPRLLQALLTDIADMAGEES